MADPKIYTVGWICAIKPEIVAARAFLDEEHKEPMASFQHDNNSYTRGKMVNHNVVIAALPKWEYGTTTAATVARDMLRTFPNIRIGLMVGVGGGVPSHEHDIRLGDVVVASRDRRTGGVVQYDYGRKIQDQPFETTGVLNQSPQSLLTAVALLESTFDLEGHQLNDAVEEALNRRPRLRKSYSRPPASHDRLFKSSITHPPGSSGDCSKENCDADPANLVSRPERGEDDDNPEIHYGLIASANQLMKDAKERDLAAEKGVLCFEMEAAGLMNHFPCLVVRGICDYSDTHKNQDWQGFAAMMAAAYAKDLLGQIAPNRVETETRLTEVLERIEANQSEQLQAVNETKASVEVIRSDSHVERIKKWLSPPDTSTNSNHARELRHEGTGAWFLNSTAFKEWKLGSRRHLWLHGIPGCGKTVLSTTVLDHLTELNDRITLDFFFDFSDTRKTNLDDMLRSLTFQLYRQRDEYARVVDSLFETHDKGQRQPGTETLAGSLRAMMKIPAGIFIVLDALDECTMRDKLVAWIKRLSSPELAHVKLIATSRPEEEYLRSIPVVVGEGNCISLSKESIDPDIRSYVKERVENSPEFADWAPYPSVLREIEHEVGSKADGMFRWAACQLDSLQTCLDYEGIQTALKSLPRDLNETYDRILQNIPSERKKKAVRLLQFLVHARRPLTLQEAVDVIAVRLNNTPRYFDGKDRLPSPANITRFCPSLVSIIRVSTDATVVEELQLAHFSVKEYLLRQHIEGFYYAEASISITLTCLTYLASIKEGCITDMRSRFPLAKYAAQVWMDHARPAEDSEDVVITTVRFLWNETTFRLWASLFQPDRAWDDNPGLPEAACLYFACLKGLTASTRNLLDKGADVNAQGGEYGNALQAASSEGHQEIVRMLLDRGADVNAEGGKYSNALQAASFGGYQQIVRMLLDKGADVNAEGGEYGNALQAASSEGYQEIVRMLLDRGADVNAEGGEYGNALQAASHKGHQEIMRMLLDRGADVNAQGGKYGNALQAASFGGYQQIVRMLLDNQADVNAKGGNYGNALQAASLRGHQEIVWILLDKEADVNAEGGTYGNALYIASYRGHQEIVRMLLDKEADVNAEGGTDGNALYIASYQGHQEIVRMLLDKEADANANSSGYYGNALQAASLGGHQQIVRMLLDRGADVNAEGGEYSNALQAASCEGHQEIVRMLLDRGADVNTEGGDYGNALYIASSEGHQEIVRMLLDRGADVNAQGGKYGNALQAASFGGHQQIIRILLDKGADVNAEGGTYSNALYIASYRGHQEIVRMLLDKEADANAVGSGYYGNALQAASLGGHQEIMRMLLDSARSKSIKSNRGLQFH